MSLVFGYLVLLLAATLEAGGDAFVRAGLHGSGRATRAGLLVAGAVVLFSYGVAVNAPAWDFGKLLGVYVTLFFVVAQVVNFVVFHVRPDVPTLVGGAFVVIGGVIMTVWR